MMTLDDKIADIRHELHEMLGGQTRKRTVGALGPQARLVCTMVGERYVMFKGKRYDPRSPTFDGDLKSAILAKG
jgi:hypothetical protein